MASARAWWKPRSDQIRRKVRVAVRDSHAEQRQGGEQASRGRDRRRAGPGTAVRRWSDPSGRTAVSYRGAAALLSARNGDASGRRTEMKCDVIGGQLGGQCGGGGVRLLGILASITATRRSRELREVLIELDGALPPGQGFREHLVGVGADAEAVHRHPGREDGQHGAGQDNGKGVAAAEVSQADEQAGQHSITGSRLGGRHLIVGSPAAVHVGALTTAATVPAVGFDAETRQGEHCRGHRGGSSHVQFRHTDRRQGRAAQPPAIPRRPCRQPAAAARVGGGTRCAQGGHPDSGGVAGVEDRCIEQRSASRRRSGCAPRPTANIAAPIGITISCPG